ncbi:glycine/betaine ABC transporter ATP-binding protein [Jeotgalicoccus coquinae]|uniref:Carnitine transport ATP-binding protein OpuCA n=1 Tax=Jeotgalicoccus coquinae TaxID=709509 RepID=A0A6V7R3S1_9STAP|nr:ABC transporter ATP-binding protein [Jeotgalicoccus coquinae]MBB6423506.1 osmoprotectant transport system ATP-binding protein [Jeotgalicoccus coquinae]GGE20349.1 glycine/betaine ABC transporter ATP-binding protein [Jeotgalicoccus coquinae]CAD2071572.1 Glycine betaine/carnitine/choline transport ATP-binding protein OpuCA [Jeotgalicoccus coquinae]
MIEFKNVTKRYGSKTAVGDASFDVEEGEFFVLIGPSGSGKTTTLKMINRLIPLTEGYIYFKDKPVSDYEVYEMRWDIGYVLQQIALFPHMTIGENIAQVPQMKKWKEKDIDNRIDELMTMVGLDPDTYKNRKPGELSGGQQQRVGVVRALAADPPVILMDEPFSALDPITRESLQDDLISLQKEIRKTIVFVTHDIKEAMKLGDRICLFNEGRIEQIGTPEEFLTHPKNDFVKEFIGSNKDKSITVGEFVSMNSGSAEHGNYPLVDEDAMIEEAFKIFAEHDTVAVITDAGYKLLNRQDVFRHLSEKRGDSA